MSRPSYVLKSSCTDTVGIVAAVTGFLAERGSLITEMSHFVDDEAQKSFIRVEFEDDAGSDSDLQQMVDSYRVSVSRRFAMRYEFYPAGQKIRTLIAVSKQSHCLNALLHRWAGTSRVPYSTAPCSGMWNTGSLKMAKEPSC